MGYYTNDLIYNQKPHKPKKGYNNNTVQNVTVPQGYYVGSASNITRLFILIIFLFTVFLTSACYYYGKELGKLEQRIEQSRVIPCISGEQYGKVSSRT